MGLSQSHLRLCCVQRGLPGPPLPLFTDIPAASQYSPTPFLLCCPSFPINAPTTTDTFNGAQLSRPTQAQLNLPSICRQRFVWPFVQPADRSMSCCGYHKRLGIYLWALIKAPLTSAALFGCLAGRQAASGQQQPPQLPTLCTELEVGGGTSAWGPQDPSSGALWSSSHSQTPWLAAQNLSL